MNELVKKPRKWHGITGSWRYEDEQLKNDVEETVRGIIRFGDGIITGGALGVDYIATQVVKEEGNISDQLRIVLPVSLERYIMHFYNREYEGTIDQHQANDLVKQLISIKEKCPDCISHPGKYKVVNEESYYGRHDFMVEALDYLHAFHVNNTSGVQDIIDKVEAAGKPVLVKKYILPQRGASSFLERFLRRVS